MSKLVTTQDVFKAMAATGMFNFTDGDQVQRVVIDLDARQKVPVVHVRLHGDERLLAVAETLDGIVVEDGA